MNYVWNIYRQNRCPHVRKCYREPVPHHCFLYTAFFLLQLQLEKSFTPESGVQLWHLFWAMTGRAVGHKSLPNPQSWTNQPRLFPTSPHVWQNSLFLSAFIRGPLWSKRRCPRQSCGITETLNHVIWILHVCIFILYKPLSHTSDVLTLSSYLMEESLLCPLPSGSFSLLFSRIISKESTGNVPPRAVAQYLMEKPSLYIKKKKTQKLTRISDGEVRKVFNKKPICEQQKLQRFVSFGSPAQGWASLWAATHKFASEHRL